MNSNHLGLFDLTGKVPTNCAAAAAVTSRDAEILRLKDELVSCPCFCSIYRPTGSPNPIFSISVTSSKVLIAV